MIICELLATGRAEAVETAIDICLARYTLCQHLLLRHLAKIMKAYGLSPLDKLPGPDGLLEEVARRVREKTEEETSPDSEIRSVARKRVTERATRIVVAALYATLGSLGVECSLG